MSKNETIKSPLGKARGMGSARDGVEHWIHQRITAIASLPLMLWLTYAVLSVQGFSYEEFTAWLAAPLNAILMILAILSVFYHAALGAQTIVEDYVHHEGFKIFKLIGIKLFFFAASVACVFSVLKIAFAG